MSVSPNPSGTKAIAAYPAFDSHVQPQGDSWDEIAPAGVDQCGNPTDGGPSGVYNFWGLIEDGLLTSNGTAASGMGFRRDTCSQTVCPVPSLLVCEILTLRSSIALCIQFGQANHGVLR